LLTEFQSDVSTFFSTLKTRLGPQLPNIQLLFHSIPEIKELLRLFGIEKLPDIETLPTQESRARFHNLVIDVIATLAQIKVSTSSSIDALPSSSRADKASSSLPDAHHVVR